MNPFAYSRATDTDQAVAGISGKRQVKFLGGGTNLIDLMKMGVETPETLIDVNRLPLEVREFASAERPRGFSRQGDKHKINLMFDSL